MTGAEDVLRRLVARLGDAADFHFARKYVDCIVEEYAGKLATLGTETCKLDDFADVPFSVDYEIEGYDMDSGRDYATLAECSACGAYILVPPEYHHVLTCDGDEVYQPYRFCPNCGRRIEQ